MDVGLIIILNHYKMLSEVIPGSDDFELLSNEDFLLLDHSNFLLLGV